MNYAQIISDALATGRNGFQQHVCPHPRGSYLAKLWLQSWREGRREYDKLKRQKEFSADLELPRERIA